MTVKMNNPTGTHFFSDLDIRQANPYAQLMYNGNNRMYENIRLRKPKPLISARSHTRIGIPVT